MVPWLKDGQREKAEDKAQKPNNSPSRQASGAVPTVVLLVSVSVEHSYEFKKYFIVSLIFEGPSTAQTC